MHRRRLEGFKIQPSFSVSRRDEFFSSGAFHRFFIAAVVARHYAGHGSIDR
jgi:hypothetical protein